MEKESKNTVQYSYIYYLATTFALWEQATSKQPSNSSSSC